MVNHVEKPGQQLARGVARMLLGMGHAPLAEFVPVSGRRVDVISISPKGEIWIIECKSSRADFRSDRKWSGYLEFCDRFFWAVGPEFPDQILPSEDGLIRADAWGADLQRMAPEIRLPAARRAKLLREIARASTARLLALTDPMALNGAAF